MRSILQEKDGTCYLCRKLHGFTGRHNYTEEHHVFEGTANRKLSEKYGLKVYLCIYHHREGPEAVHRNALNASLLKMDAQAAFERTHTREEFMRAFGRNWLETDPLEEANEEWAAANGAEAPGETEWHPDAAGFEMLAGDGTINGMDSTFIEIEKAAAARGMDSRSATYWRLWRQWGDGKEGDNGKDLLL